MQQGLSLINTECPSDRCIIVGNSAKLYDSSMSAFYKKVSMGIKEPPTVAVYDRNDRDLQTVGFKGYACDDVFYLPLKTKDRLTKFEGKFLSISDIQHTKHTSFETGYSGFVGFQPYTFDEKRKEENFMWQLKNQGLIDHLTVSFFIVNTGIMSTSSSTVKFGSMDKAGLADSPVK